MISDHNILGVLKLRARNVIFLFLSFFMIFILCSCSFKEHHQHSKIILIKETSETSTNNVIETVSDIPTANEKVYYTKSGKRYHCINKCGRGTYYECTLDEAKQKGLSPCDKCVK